MGSPRRLAVTIGAIAVLVAAQLGIGLAVLSPASEGFALAFAAMQLFVGVIACRLTVVLAHVLRSFSSTLIATPPVPRAGPQAREPLDGDENRVQDRMGTDGGGREPPAAG